MFVQRAFTSRELIAVIATASIAATILSGLAPEPHGPPPRTFQNLRYIAQAANIYCMDNDGYLPMVLTYRQRGITQQPGNSLAGWCTWSFGGKNNDPWWVTGLNGGYDVEAADRPLNPYILPEAPFYAPPFPTALPGDDPHRLSEQAEMFHDPGDLNSLQRRWPQPVKGVTGYDDVGTSYLTNMTWWDQFPRYPFVRRFDEGTRRIAAGEGVDPARFVWLTDHYGDVLANLLDSRYRLRNGYGDWNAAPLLFIDGHASYESISPGVHTTPRYTFYFE